MRIHRSCFILAGLLFPLTSALAVDPSLPSTPAAATPPATAKIDFSAQIQPLLSKYCYACHGPDQQKSGLRLDKRDIAIAPADSEEISIVPGDPKASRLMKVIDGRDPEFQMPPKGAKPTQAQIDLIRQWISQGAEYNQHWSFIAPKRPALPMVKQKDWPRNPIDHFVLARLEKEALSPAPQADAFALARRVHLDLIGIPPTPEEADAFVKEWNTENDAAYERLVDRLLASPQYGERWARKWLDLARYADTNGYEKDRTRSIWPYRDWVINAINNDMPFDQFTIEQIAGDMLQKSGDRNNETGNAPKPTHSGAWVSNPLTATGFHRNTMINEEGGIDVEEFRYHAVVDRVNTTSATWLGLTIGCAQCHTHKYDPITHKEYFQLYAFLNNADEPEAEVASPELLQQQARIDALIREKENALADRFPMDAPGELVWSVLEPKSAVSEAAAKLEILGDHTVLARGPAAAKDKYTITATTPLKDIIAIKLEVLPHPTLPKTGPGRAPNGNFVLTEFALTASAADKPGNGVPVFIRSAAADLSQNQFDVAGAIDGKPETGWAIDDATGNMNKPRTAQFILDRTIQHAAGSNLTITLDQQYGSQHLLGRFRILVGRAKPSEDDGKNDKEPKPVSREDHLAAQLQKWIDAQTPSARRWTTLRPTAITATKGGTFITQPDDAILVTGDNPNQNVYTFHADTPLDSITAIRLEVLPDESLPNGGPGRAPLFSDGDFHLGEFLLHASPRDAESASQRLALHMATHSFAQAGRSAQQAIDGDPDTAWSIKGGTGKAHQAVFQLKVPQKNPKGFKLTFTLDQRYIHQMTIGKFRIAVTGDAQPVKASALPAEIETILAAPQTTWNAAQLAAVRQHFLLTTPLLADLQGELARLRAARPRGPRTMVMQERLPVHTRTTHIHKRGEFLQPTDAVMPGVPAILHPLRVKPQPAGGTESPTRLDFARWLVDERNPLVGRVVMNRHWHAFFGRGIVRTIEDFGLQGEKPSHPDLLDWLAIEFIEGSKDAQSPRPHARGFSLKHMHKLIVMSATYRQSSTVTPTMIARDPTNELLTRGPRFRVEAEIIRDGALAAAGLLTQRIGGPSVFPPQPEGVTSLGYGGFNWPTATGENRYRRGLYTFAKRTTPFAAFVTFDGPTGDTCLVRRDRSNTPLQALTMMNDPVFVEASQALAKRLLSEPRKSDEDRIHRLFRLVLTRPPTNDEAVVLAQFLERQRDRLKKGTLDAAKIAGHVPKGMDTNEAAAWTTLARSVMNLDEAVTKE